MNRTGLVSKSYFLLFLSALLSALSFTFPSLFFLSWFSFVPFYLVFVLGKKTFSLKGVIGKGFFFGFLYHLFVYFWFFWLYPMDFAGFEKGFSLVFILIAFLGISAIHGAMYIIPSLLCYFVSKKVKRDEILIFTLLIGVLFAQFLQGLGELAFPWVRVSLGQYRVPILIQSASLFGMTGVDFILLLFSALLSLGFLNLKTRKSFVCFFLAVFIFLSNFLFGVASLLTKTNGEEITASLVQGNISASEKFSGADWSELYSSLTENISDSDLVLWPESAIPVDLSKSRYMLEEFQALSEKIDTPILLGCFWEQNGFDTNGAVLVRKDAVSAPYAKRHLVPFGEHIPYSDALSKALPFLSNLNLRNDVLIPGEETALFELEKGKLGGMICFESLFPALARESVQDGANLIVLITNDAWYKDSPAVYQHLAHAVFRSVENGRGTLRCAGTGISAIIDEKGRITEEIGPLQRGVLTGEIAFSEENTLYTKIGDVFLPILTLCWIGVVLFCSAKERRGENA